MSRIGKKPIPLPTGVKYTVSENGNTVLVEGPKGKVSALLPGGITLVQKDGNLITERQNDKQAAFHGLGPCSRLQRRHRSHHWLDEGHRHRRYRIPS